MAWLKRSTKPSEERDRGHPERTESEKEQTSAFQKHTDVRPRIQ